MRRLPWPLLILVFLGALACERRDSTDQGLAAPIPQNGTGSNGDLRSQGGVDSSGGETPRSSEHQIRRAVERQYDHLPTAYSRVKAFYEEWAEVQSLEQEIARFHPQAPISKNRFRVFDDPSLRLMERLFASHPTGSDLFAKIRTMKFHFQEEPCIGEFKDPRDMSVTPQGQVCVSIERLRNVPPQHLDNQILALLTMESSHLIDFDRTDASAVRDWFLAHPEIVLERAKEFGDLEKFFRDALSDQNRLLELLSRKRFGNDQLRDRLHEVEKTFRLLTFVFLESHSVRLPVLLEHRIHQLSAEITALDRSENRALSDQRIESDEARRQQTSLGQKVIKLQDQTLTILNQIRAYQNPDQTQAHLHWQDHGHRYLVESGRQSFGGELSVADQIVCTIHSASSSFAWESPQRWQGSSGNPMAEQNVELRNDQGELLGRLELNWKPGPFNQLVAFFRPTETAAEVRLLNSEGGSWHAISDESRPHSGFTLLLEPTDPVAVSGLFEVFNRARAASQAFEITCLNEKH